MEKFVVRGSKSTTVERKPTLRGTAEQNACEQNGRPSPTTSCAPKRPKPGSRLSVLLNAPPLASPRGGQKPRKLQKRQSHGLSSLPRTSSQALELVTTPTRSPLLDVSLASQSHENPPPLPNVMLRPDLQAQHLAEVVGTTKMRAVSALARCSGDLDRAAVLLMGGSIHTTKPSCSSTTRSISKTLELGSGRSSKSNHLERGAASTMMREKAHQCDAESTSTSSSRPQVARASVMTSFFPRRDTARRKIAKKSRHLMNATVEHKDVSDSDEPELSLDTPECEDSQTLCDETENRPMVARDNNLQTGQRVA
ncbi:unnamed protein product, partial [Choristocarpus tenellus]